MNWRRQRKYLDDMDFLNIVKSSVIIGNVKSLLKQFYEVLFTSVDIAIINIDFAIVTWTKMKKKFKSDALNVSANKIPL